MAQADPTAEAALLDRVEGALAGADEAGLSKLSIASTLLFILVSCSESRSSPEITDKLTTPEPILSISLSAALLVPCLAKLASPNAATRSRVPTVLQHFLARIRPAESVQLPLDDLVSLWSSQNVGAPLVLLFIEIAWRRAALLKRQAQLPLLLSVRAHRYASTSSTPLTTIKGFAARTPVALQAQVFQLLLTALPLPEETWTPAPADRDTLLTYMQWFMLLPAGALTVTPPGLSLSQARLLMGKKSSWGTEELAQTKAHVLKMLTNTAYDATQVHCILLAGAADAHHSVVGSAEDALKRSRMGQHVKLESVALVDHMIMLYLGSAADANAMAALSDDDKVAPASVPLKLRLLQELNKSVAAAGRFPRILQVLFDAVFNAMQPVARLRLAGMAFLQWLAKHAPVAPLRNLAPLLLSQLLKFIDSTPDTAQRNAAYDAVGLLARRAPAPFAADPALLPRLFNALKEEAVRSSVRDALTCAASAFADPPAERVKAIESLLLTAAEADEAAARFAAVFCSLRIFAFNHPPARLVCLLASADGRPEVRDEALRGLRPYVRRDGEAVSSSSAPYPSFVAMVTCMHTALLTRPALPDAALVCTPAVHEQALAFLGDCLTSEASLKYPQDSALATARFVSDLMASSDATTKAAVGLFEGLTMPLLSVSVPLTCNAAALRALTLIGSSVPNASTHLKSLAPPSGTLSATLLRLLTSARLDVREDAARLLGLLSASDAAIVDSVLALANNVATSPESLHAAVVALGACVAVERQVPLAVPLQISVITRLVALSRSSVAHVAAAACTSLGQCGRHGTLPLDIGASAEESSAGAPITQWTVLKLLSDLLNGADRRVAERAASAIGSLVGLGSRSNVEMMTAAQKALLTQAAEKQEDVQLTIGEALAVLAAGGSASCARDALLDGPVPQPPAPTDGVGAAVVTAVVALTASPLGPVRCSAAVWLLCLLQHAGNSPTFATQTSEACAALASLLGDVHELTAEAAARGLVVAYERATDETQKNSLLQQLMKSLTGTTAPQAPKRSADSEIFEEGTLGQTPDGSALSTYRELSSLAAETGQPDLLYRMLGLAQHHAIWNSRRAAAFAATALASRADAASAMQAHLPVLLPRLFRSSHDPSTRVAQATLSILKALAPDVRRAVQQHLNAVLTDLVPSMGGREWRIRQAAASATAEAVSGAGLVELGPWLERLWTMAFRVADDVKETGMSLLRTLINLSVRLCDPHHSNPEAVASALQLLIPFLLKKGLIAETKEARAATLMALQKLAKVAGALIAPHVPDLSAVLLESLSAHESGMANYAAQHVQSLGIDPAQLEAARVAASAASPAAETLDQCVRYTTADTITPLIARIGSLIQSGVGLPTRAATSKFLCNLIRMHRNLCEGQLGKLLRPLLGTLRERSPAVRRGFAAAAAQVAAVQGASAVREVSEWLEKHWLGESDEAERLAAPVLLLELCKADAGACRMHPSLLALCLLALQDTEEESKKCGMEAWSDLGGWPSDPDTQSQVLATLKIAVNAQTWTLRKHAAQALTSLATERRIAAASALELMAVCTDAMAGRAWGGKECLYEAAAALAPIAFVQGDSLEQSAAHTALANALWKESTRGEKKLRTAAVTALAAVLKNKPPRTSAMYEDLRSVLSPILTVAPEHTGDTAEAVEERAEALKYREAAVNALCAAFPAAISSSIDATSHAQLLASLRLTNPWQVSAAALRGLVSLVERGAPLSVALVASGVETAIAGLGDTKYSSVRTPAAALIAALKSRDPALLAPHLQTITQVLPNN